MNPFYDISHLRELPTDSLQVRNLGPTRIIVGIGQSTRNNWGERRTEWNNLTRDTKPEDYDKELAHKLLKFKPIYKMKMVLDHHLNHYCISHSQGLTNFLEHMRYVVLPAVRKIKNSDVCVTLFVEWLEANTAHNGRNISPHIVNNNTINVGTVNAPVQLQQNSDHSIQTQHNQPQKDQLKEFFGILQKDIQLLDENIRKDFAMEMNYALSQMDKDRDIRPQLSHIGRLMKDTGLNLFANILSTPIFEFIKPFLGLS